MDSLFHKLYNTLDTTSAIYDELRGCGGTAERNEIDHALAMLRNQCVIYQLVDDPTNDLNDGDVILCVNYRTGEITSAVVAQGDMMPDSDQTYMEAHSERGLVVCFDGSIQANSYVVALLVNKPPKIEKGTNNAKS